MCMNIQIIMSKKIFKEYHFGSVLNVDVRINCQSNRNNLVVVSAISMRKQISIKERRVA